MKKLLTGILILTISVLVGLGIAELSKSAGLSEYYQGYWTASSAVVTCLILVGILIKRN